MNFKVKLQGSVIDDRMSWDGCVDERVIKMKKLPDKLQEAQTHIVLGRFQLPLCRTNGIKELQRKGSEFIFKVF